MKVNLTCFTCVENKNKYKKIYSLEIKNDNIYPFTCDEGHDSIVIFNIHRYELLFEMGVYALLDGYYREAIANFAASIERFHEFSIEIFINRSKKTTEEYEKAWKLISKQSERQLGAYIMLYLSTFKKSPQLFEQKQIELRNDVIHKGKFPTFQEAYGYAEKTFDYILFKLVELKENMDQVVEYVYEKDLRSYLSNADVDGKHIVSWSELTTFNSARPIKELKGIIFTDAFELRKHYKIFNK